MDTFELFVTLPTELRIKIWKFTFPEPRVVPVRFNRSSQQYTSTTAPAAVAHACSESRSIFLETYTKPILSPRYTSAVFVDFERDTIFFDNLDCSPDGDLSLDLARSPHADRILHCAIDANVWEVLRVFRHDSLSEVKMMPNLKTVALVMAKDYDGALQMRVGGYGTQSMFVDDDSNTVGSEIRYMRWYVESLKWDITHRQEEFWGGNTPLIQMWLL